MFWIRIYHRRLALVGSAFSIFSLFFFSAATQAASNHANLPLCVSAVSQTAQYIASNRQLAQMRHQQQAIATSVYEQRLIELDDIEATVSVEQCMAAATGDSFHLYQCLASNKGNYAVCR